MPEPVCNNVIEFPIFWIIAGCIIAWFIWRMFQKHKKFNDDLKAYHEAKRKRKDVIDEVYDVELPNYNRHMLFEITRLILILATAVFGYLATNNITYAFTVNQTCIVSPNNEPFATIVPPTPTESSTELPTVTSTYTETPTITFTATSLNTLTPTLTLTNTVTITLTPTATNTVKPTATHTFTPIPTETNTVTPTSTVTHTPTDIADVIGTGCFPRVEIGEVVYEEDFDNRTAVGFNYTRYEAVPNDNNQIFLGRFTNQSVQLSLNDLPQHSEIYIYFDLYIIESWNGNYEENPDIWMLQVDESTLMRTTFSNNDRRAYHPQAFPGLHSDDSNPPRTCATANDSLGYRYTDDYQDRDMDSTYELGFKIEHNAESATIIFSGEGLGERFIDESWGLDNVVITIR